MYFFESNIEKNFKDIRKEKLYLADCLIREIDEALNDKSSKNLRSVKSAIFDIAVLERVVSKLGFNVKLNGDLRKIRDSLAHIDERMEDFNYQPTEINDIPFKREEFENKFKHTLNMNFQGAVNRAIPTIPIDPRKSASIKLVSLYGMFNHNFLWIDKKGIQRSTEIKTIIDCYKDFLDALKKSEKKLNSFVVN